jgi:hypothetical protein
MAFRDSASFGKRQEFTAIAELLRRDFDVYLTLVDDQGIDCIIRRDADTYIDVQIKARSRKAKQWSTFAAMQFEPRRNLYFIFYTERGMQGEAGVSNFWIMPSETVAQFAVRNRTGSNAGRYRLDLPKVRSGIKFQKFAQFFNDAGFDALRAFRTTAVAAGAGLGRAAGSLRSPAASL